MTMIDIVNSDCVRFLESPLCPKFNMAFADPPFNIGQKYNEYIDGKTDHEYREWLRSWIWPMWNKLAKGGVMVLHGSQKVARLFTLTLDHLGILENVEQELCWAYNFGQCVFTRFIETNTRCLVVRKPGKPKKWNFENVKTESVRLKTGDPRALESKHGGYIPFGTVWGLVQQDCLILEPIEGEENWGRVQGNNKERRDFNPNQLPEAYMTRIISAYSDPGDLIYDPFAGTGTTAIVAQRLLRNCISTEISKRSCECIREIIARNSQ